MTYRVQPEPGGWFTVRRIDGAGVPKWCATQKYAWFLATWLNTEEASK